MPRVEAKFKGRIAPLSVKRPHPTRQTRRLMYAGFRTALCLVCASILSMTLPAQGQDFNSLTHKPLISATGTPYLADPTGKKDATNAIQSCINDTVAKRAACVLPAGIYTISGSGLTMPSQSSLLGLQNLGDGSPSLIYYGTGTAITIGNCSDTSKLAYGVNLVNVGINAGNNPKYGIQACGLSEANWDGLSVGNSSTTGYFTGANIRFYDSAEIDLLNLTLGNPGYQSGTTGILFDDFGQWGNATITIHGAASGIFAFQNALVCKSCINIAVRDTLIEGNDYGLFVDNSTWSSPSDGLANVNFESDLFLTHDITGPTHNKVLQVNSTGGAKLVAENLVFRSTKWQLANGVTYPVELNIPSTGANSVFSLKLDTNRIDGAGTAVVDSDNFLALISFTGENDITDTSGTGTRPADVHGAATVSDYAPLNTSQQPLFWTDPSGAVIMPGYNNTISRPAANTLFPGLVFGTTLGNPFSSDFGFLRVGAGGSVTAVNKSYCDFSGPDSTPDLNQTIDCFAGGIKINRMDAYGEHPIAVNVLAEIGANNAIASRASASNPALGFGLVVTVPLAHTLQAGADTFAYEIPISTCTNANPMVCTSTSAPANGTTVLISGLTGGWTTGNGTYPATNINGTTFSVPVDSRGFGAFSATNPGWGNVIAIKSSFNPADNIATGYAAGGAVVIFYNGSAWLDLKQ